MDEWRFPANRRLTSAYTHYTHTILFHCFVVSITPFIIPQHARHSLPDSPQIADRHLNNPYKRSRYQVPQCPPLAGRWSWPSSAMWYVARPRSWKGFKLMICAQICANCSIGHHELLGAISYCQDTLHLPLTFEIEFLPFRLIPTRILPDDNTPKVSKEDFFTSIVGKDNFASMQASVMKWSKEKNVPMCAAYPYLHQLNLIPYI